MKEILCLKKNIKKYESGGPFTRVKTCPNGPKVIFLLKKHTFWNIYVRSGPSQLGIVLVFFYFLGPFLTFEKKILMVLVSGLPQCDKEKKMLIFFFTILLRFSWNVLYVLIFLPNLRSDLFVIVT